MNWKNNITNIYWQVYGSNKRPGPKPVVFKNVNVIADMWTHYELTDKERNFLFKKVANKYIPYMLAFIKNDCYTDREEVLQKYRIKVLDCLDTYNGFNNRTNEPCTFNTFLFGSIKIVGPNYFNIDKPLVKNHITKIMDPVHFNNIKDFNDVLIINHNHNHNHNH